MNEWTEKYDATIEERFRKKIEVGDRHGVLELFDTAGVKEFSDLRPAYIKEGHGFLLVFSITSKSSLFELEDLYEQIQRLKAHDRVPVVLVGNKADLEDRRAIPASQAGKVSQQWGVPYYETSALHNVNVDQVFADLYRQMMHDERKDPMIDDQLFEARSNMRIRHKGRQRRPRGRGERRNGLVGQRMRALLRKLDGMVNIRSWSKLQLMQRKLKSGMIS
ncbi:hypothetical protein DPSP01_014627 [Paraphaeosphaeria sporulosa]